MLRALGQIRRMRGGVLSHLVRCRDGRDHDLYCAMKFQNNPQPCGVLVNELLGSGWRGAWACRRRPLAVEVSEEVIRLTPDLSAQRMTPEQLQKYREAPDGTTAATRW